MRINMNLLEKITLYDLLGYTLPGCVMLYVLKIPKKLVEGNGTQINTIYYIAIGFLAGIILSELSNLLTALYKGRPETKKRIEDKLEISPSKVKKALNKAGLLTKNETAADKELLWRYFTNMFSDIQIDNKYSRIHNYASAELLYKNIALVCIICAAAFWHRNLCIEMWLSLTASAIFFRRWQRFYEKKVLYTVYWYVHKYISSCPPQP